MNSEKTGALIRRYRLDKGLTQKQLAQQIAVSAKTVSKWETGKGSPDVSLWQPLAQTLDTDAQTLLTGEAVQNEQVGGNMKKLKYYVCPVCGNLTVCTGNAAVSCCGKQLAELTPRQAQKEEQLTVQVVEDEWLITSDCSMSRESYIHFTAFVTDDSIHMIKLYPEWDLCVRFPKRRHGRLVWYSTRQGLLWQKL